MLQLFQANAQVAQPMELTDLVSDKEGQFYVTWGYNRVYYNKSTVHFKGEHYDFTMYDVRAEDMPEEWNPRVHLNPEQFTVPQFNFRIGYYFNRNTAISGGWDHMKYHFIPYQMVEMSGYISDEHYALEQYTGNFDRDDVIYSPSFMDYHHSDGFNFIRFALEKRIPAWHSPRKRAVLSFNGALSAGIVMPWTDFTFFGVHYRNKPHVAGYGFSGSLAMRLEFFKYLFFQLNAQSGWTNLTDIMLQDHLSSRAQQKIVFFERSFSLGGYIPIFKKHKS